MAVTLTRRELLERWRAIEEEDADDDDGASLDPSKRCRFQQLKEAWFSDAFNFLIYLPKENHIWCGSWELMGPLLETFYNYFKDDRHDSPLKLLWKRISEELQQCMQCVCQHHQAKETYSMEYELSTIGPLLKVLCRLDEERVTKHLKEMNTRIACGEYDSVNDNAKVISVMYEVLMFPVLLDDHFLATEFQTFIEAVDDSHELALAGHQQYPGVYALLFLKSRRSRSIGLRLAGQIGKIRRATDLDPLQPLLKKCIVFLETEVLTATSEISRPRVQLDRITVWLGIKALLGFLEPPAFEEGILERYPSFLSIVLNHICDDSPEFSYAVNCLRLLFEMLGCKLWLRATLSPSVMRDTLLGQCFHTRDEKCHKEIFDLFLHFLQSLEALQDGEHEKQRRHFLYFLLHQVTVSSNFSTLMRKKACQIALRIIHRGYKMIPSCPPFECGHMWGPSLVSSLKDSSLYSSLRQPAFDLIQTIIVADAAALVSSIQNCIKPEGIDRSRPTELKDEEDDEEILCLNDAKEKHTSCWDEFSVQSQTTAQDHDCWMCIPMLWFDVLIGVDPSVLPLYFSKAVFWALSRFSMIEPESSAEMALPVTHWSTACAPEISQLFGWKIPTGSNDAGDGNEFKNSVKVTTMCIPLIRTFRRFAAHFLVRMEQSDLCKQWTWEPRMGESLILFLVDPDDNARQVGRRILEQVSNKRGLLSCLQFLCSSTSSLSAIFLGLRHVLKLLQLDSVLLRFQNLHHLFFVLCKLLKEGVQSGNILSDDKSILNFSSQGGFLHQPVFDSLPSNIDGHSEKVDRISWKKFSFLLSEIAWPPFCRCLTEGKAFIDNKLSQMTCIRLLEILPVVVERLLQSLYKSSGNSSIVIENVIDYKWLHDLIDWGKSSLAVVVRYWKETVLALLDLLKESCNDKSTSAIMAIKKLIQCDNIAMDELTEQVSRLSVSLKNGLSEAYQKPTLSSKSLEPVGLLHKGGYVDPDPGISSLEDSDVQILDSSTDMKMERESLIDLSDDDSDIRNRVDVSAFAPQSNQLILNIETSGFGAAERSSQNQEERSKTSSIACSIDLLDDLKQVYTPDSLEFVSPEMKLERVTEKLETDTVIKPNSEHSTRKENLSLMDKSSLKKLSDKDIDSETVNSIPYQHLPVLKKMPSSNDMEKPSGMKTRVIKDLVHDAEPDPWEFALKSARHSQSHLTKLNIGGPKRQVIQLDLPRQNRYSQINRLEVHQRFKPPKLDEWYRPILEIDYFAIVGLASAGVVENHQSARALKEVPVSFQSPDEYVAIFRPLVLEEFKAQLHSSYVEMASLEEMSCGCLSVLSVERIDDFHVVRCVHDDTDLVGSKSCMENDLILLTRQPLHTSSHDVHMVGKVERREKDNKRKSCILVIRFYLQNGSSRLNRARKLLQERSKWHIIRLLSIIPQLREFQALSSIKNISLLPTILNPSHQPLRADSRKDLSKLAQPLQKILRSSYNDSQIQAISAASRPLDVREDYDLSLVQGPPGTGKTRTIVAIVSALLACSGKDAGKRPQTGALRPSITTPTSKLQMNQSAAIARAWQDAALARQLHEDEGKSHKCMASYMRGRVLICAQSNAAVDELVARISSKGLYGNDGLMYKPYLVRVGNSKTVHPSSLPFFIDTLVEHHLAEERNNVGDMKNDMSGDSSTVIRSNLEKLVNKIRLYEAKRANLRDGNPDSKDLLEGDATVGDDVKEWSDAEMEAKLKKLYGDKKQIYIDLTAAQAREKKAREESKALKHKLRKSILKEAEIVITTLSGCGGDLYGVCSESIMSHKFSSSAEYTLFDAVVIDEAAQALEPATLIPLQLLKSKGSKCIMVGDPKQLPATVLSNVASKYLYECSMFERLQKAGHPVTMLTKQYRMHPEICRFPSLHFYDGKLLNGEEMSSKEAQFHRTAGLGPYLFFDIVDGLELHGKNSGAQSLYNECEAEAAVELLRFFKESYPSEFYGGRIGIITPYKSQLSLLRSRFSSAFGSWILDELELNTVDGFQGREVDILVLSTVRAADPCRGSTKIKSSNIGFVADVRRMNVALTRARFSLWILGNVRTLQTNENWGALVNDAKERNLVLSVKRPYSSMFYSHLKRDKLIDTYHNNPRQLKHKAKVKEVSKHAEQEKDSNRSFERKRSHPGNHFGDNLGGDGHSFPTSREPGIANKKPRHRSESSTKKDCVSVDVGNSDKKIKKSSIAKGQVSVDENEGKQSGRKQFNLENAVAGVGKGVQDCLRNSVRSEKVVFDGDPVKDSAMPSKISELDSTQHRGGDGSSIEVGKAMDKICKRKQQRDAVEALLSSALISSKKPGVSSKSVPPPRKASVHAVKPPKPRKG